MDARKHESRGAGRWAGLVAAAAALAYLMIGASPAGGAAPPVRAASVERGEGGIELHAQGEDIRVILELLARQSQLNIVPSKNVQGTLKADFYGVTVEEVIEAICRANDLKWVREEDFIYIHTPSEMAAILEADERLETEVFHLNYLTAEEAKNLINPVLSRKGTSAETTASETGIPTASANVGGDSYPLPDTIVVRDFPENLDQVRRILTRMDRRPRQVLVEATILSVTLNDETDLGVDFNALAGVDFRDLSTTTPAVVDPTALPNDGTTTVDVNVDPSFGHIFTRGFAAVGNGLNVGIVTNNISVFVNALEEIRDTTILSNPKVLALNKQPAEVNVGDQIGYRGDVTSTETSEVAEAEFLDVGTVLRFRPWIADDGFIRMEVHPEVSQRGEETIDGVPSKRTTQVTCNVMIRDGHTLVIGGLFDETAEIERNQIPGLGSIPWLGTLFRSKGDSTVRNEIIILLTPHVIDHEEDNLVAERIREDAKVRAIGLREGFHWFSRERLTVIHVQDADKAWRKYESTGSRLALDRAWWETRLALNVAPNNLHALRLKDKILEARGKGMRPGRSWTIWDKVSEHIKPHIRTDDVQDFKATAEEGKEMGHPGPGLRRERTYPLNQFPPQPDEGPAAAAPSADLGSRQVHGDIGTTEVRRENP